MRHDHKWVTAVRIEYAANGTPLSGVLPNFLVPLERIFCADSWCKAQPGGGEHEPVAQQHGGAWPDCKEGMPLGQLLADAHMEGD